MPQDEPDERSWAEYRRLILAELERIDRGMVAMNAKMEVITNLRDETIAKMRVEIAMLKVQAGAWGAAAGLAGAAIASTFLIQLTKH